MSDASVNQPVNKTTQPNRLIENLSVNRAHPYILPPLDQLHPPKQRKNSPK